MMNIVLKIFLLVLLSYPLSSHQLFASHHSDGSSSGSSGGSGDSGDDNSNPTRNVPTNPEEKIAPSGFKGTSGTSKRTYKAKIGIIPAAQLQLLKSKGYVSQTEQNQQGEKAWSSTASQKSQSQWNKHSLTGLDVAAQVGGVSSVDTNALPNQGTNNSVSAGIANAAWSIATQQRGSVGEAVTSGLGITAYATPAFTKARNTSTLNNLIKQ